MRRVSKQLMKKDDLLVDEIKLILCDQEVLAVTYTYCPFMKLGPNSSRGLREFVSTQKGFIRTLSFRQRQPVDCNHPKMPICFALKHD